MGEREVGKRGRKFRVHWRTEIDEGVLVVPHSPFAATLGVVPENPPGTPTKHAHVSCESSNAEVNKDREPVGLAEDVESLEVENPSPANLPKVSDAAIRKDWEALESAIEGLVLTSLPGYFSPQGVRTSMWAPENVFATHPLGRAMLNNLVHCAFLVQSCVWRILYSNVLKLRSRLWNYVSPPIII